MLHIPILRHGEPYQSLDVARVPHHQTRELFVEISQANNGLVRRDLRDQKTGRDKLAALSTAELIEICARAADHFLNDALPLGDGMQTPEDYVRQIAATTGMPHVLARRNMAKIQGALSEADNVINGLTRNIDWQILDRGFGEIDGRSMSFYPRTESLGVVLPNNSPGVHTLWIPAIPLKIPLVLKPGSAEPWSPYRIIQAFIRAGAPREAFSFYPTDHAGSGELLRQCERGIVFGDAASTSLWNNDPRIEIHGPGLSKIVIGDDCIDDWEKYLDVMVRSIADNGDARVSTPRDLGHETRRAISEALAERLAKILPRAADDPEAALAPLLIQTWRPAFAVDRSGPQRAGRARSHDVLSRRRSWRTGHHDGCSYLLPTVVCCKP